MPQNPTTGIDDVLGPQGGAPVGDAPNIIHTLGYAANGKPVVQAVGNATDDAGIIAEIGADAKFADGSLYLSTATGALFQKRSDVWVSI
jgi:hypothetical protein